MRFFNETGSIVNHFNVDVNARSVQVCFETAEEVRQIKKAQLGIEYGKKIYSMPPKVIEPVEEPTIIPETKSSKGNFLLLPLMCLCNMNMVFVIIIIIYNYFQNFAFWVHCVWNNQETVVSTPASTAQLKSVISQLCRYFL